MSFGTKQNGSRPASKNEKQSYMYRLTDSLVYSQILKANFESIFVYHFVPNNVVYSKIFALSTAQPINN